MTADVNTIRQRLAAYGQEHVLRWWHELDEARRACLLEQLESIDLDLLCRLCQEAPASFPSGRVEPAPVTRLADSFEAWQEAEEAADLGETSLRGGEVAILMVAGGQGTRLGHAGPKGTFPIGPVTQRSLFQIHCQKVLALSRRYQQPLPLCIMTSPDNDAATREFFAEHNNFGLEPGQVRFFVQGTMPVVDAKSKKLLLADKGQLALSPNGHGGVVEALARAGLMDQLRSQGVRRFFYFQVDNPLVKVADPVFLGQHLKRRAEMSLKVVAKTVPEERLGVVVRRDDRLHVIEYSDLPEEWARRRDRSGRLQFWAGSIAIHVFELEFLDRLARTSALPYHRALKCVPYVNERGELVRPTQANAIKFERFVFDALPLAERALVLETDRRQEFEPLKNPSGENSPDTVRQALSNLYADWLQAAGTIVPLTPTGDSLFPIEIAPLFACDAEELRGKRGVPAKVTGPLVLE
jgi:UDP-N-acetylglucosamine/UDP-N-acetylgalactosamine diphosphorylase